MSEYVFKVKVLAEVRVRAVDESVARQVVSSVLRSPSTDEIGLANDNNGAIGRNATVIDVDFDVDGPTTLFEVDGQTVQQTANRGRRPLRKGAPALQA
jgi:hypothetical protein